MKKLIDKIFMLLEPYQGLPKEVYVIFISRMINAMGAFVFPMLTLLLTTKIGLTGYQAGILLSLSGILFMPAGFIGGKLADTFGRKKIIIICDSIGAISFISCAFIPPSYAMIIMIMFAGASMSIAGPAHDSLISDITEPENREGAFSLTYMGFNLGFAIGPFLGGMLFQNHLSLFFVIDGITALLSTVMILIFISETIETTKEDLDESRKMEKREEGSVFSVLLKRPVLIYFALIAFGYNFVYSQWSFLIPMHIESVYVGHGAELYGKLASFNGLLVIIFTPLITKYFAKIKPIRKIAIGGVLYTFGFGMLGYMNDIFAFTTCIFIMTLGEICISISSMPFIANRTPASHRGRINAILPFVMGLGWTLGPFGMGKILNSFNIEFAWKSIGVIMLVYTALTLILEKYDDKETERLTAETV